MQTQVFSIGYERRSFDELVELLKQFRISAVFDVRELATSRRKGFSKKALAFQLEIVGIDYRHLKYAGNPHRKQKNNIERCLHLYTDYLIDNPHVVDLLAAELSGISRVAVLCYEREHSKCHRSVLLDAIIKRGCDIELVKVE